MNRFTKSDTTLVKGIGIILLLLHHIIGVNPGIPMCVWETPFHATIGSASKVCVSLFMILSGYGMTEVSRLKGKCGYRFIFERLKKLYTHFWECWIVLFVWALVRGESPLTDVYCLNLGPIGLTYLFRDLVGFHSFGSLKTPTLSGVFWFMEAIVICYLLFPILIRFFQRAPIIIHLVLLLITYTPWVYYQYKLDYAMHTDRALFYIFSFCLGMFLSWYHILDIVKQYGSTKKFISIVGSTVLLIVSFLIRQKFCLPADPFFAVSIMIIVTSTLCQLPKNSVVKDTILLFGECEADLYLLHPAMLGIFSIIPFQNVFYKCLFEVMFCGAMGWSYYSCRNYIRSLLCQNCECRKIHRVHGSSKK